MVVSKYTAFFKRSIVLGGLLPGLALLQYANVTVSESAPLNVSQAWVRAMPPGQRMTAAYFTVTNKSEAAVTVSQVTSELGEASLHETRVVDGRSTMRPVPQLELAPAGSVVLQPGGLHVMLMGLAVTPQEGESIELCLQSSAGDTCFSAPVLRSAASADNTHDEHSQ